jgi:hypothetical protein
MTRKHDEFYARQPYPSWVWNSFDFLLGLALFRTPKALTLALTNGMKKQHLGLSEKQHERNASPSTQSPVLYGQR